MTKDNTPTIFLRLDDAILLNDLPGNAAGTPGAPPPIETIPITFNTSLANTPVNQTPGFRVAVFDEGVKYTLIESTELRDVRLFDAQGRVALQLPLVRTALSVGSLWRLSGAGCSGSALVFRSGIVHLDLFPDGRFSTDRGEEGDAPRLDIRRQGSRR